MKLVYFAWIREKIGVSEEQLVAPANVTTINELFDFLKKSDKKYAHAFENQSIINVAINHEQVLHDSTLKDANEIAFFPPMTGG